MHFHDAFRVKIAGPSVNGLADSLPAWPGGRLIQPTGNEARFGVRGPDAGQYTGRSITTITVQKFE
jgi:hypothetical protein